MGQACGAGPDGAAAIDGFVVSVESIAGLVPDGGELVHVRFREAAYTDALFADRAIALPDSLERAVPRRRADFLAGRIAAREALRPLGLEASEIAAGEDRAPIWPGGVIGSLSHSAGHAVAACRRSGRWLGLGVDVEAVAAASRSEELRSTIGGPREWAALSSPEAPIEPGLAFTLLFSAKESLYKALYPRLRRILDYDSMELRGHDPATAALLFRACVSAPGVVREGDILPVSYRLIDDSVFTACLL